MIMVSHGEKKAYEKNSFYFWKKRIKNIANFYSHQINSYVVKNKIK